jgi:radical SAM superfamily enzyme YgiQ (UPF0313 family)
MRDDFRGGERPVLSEGPLPVALVNLRAEGYPVRSVPTALLTLGAVAKKHCDRSLDLRYFDRQIDDLDSLVRAIAGNQPVVVGLSAQFGTRNDLHCLLSRMEKEDLKPLVVVGNVTGTYAAEEILADHPWVACCIGRGEETWIRLLHNAACGGSWLDPIEVPNLAFTTPGGELVRTSAQSVPAELIGPADWDGFFSTYSHKRYSEVWVEASRGCPQKRGGVGCVYCAILPEAGSRDWSPRPLSVVSEDLSRLASHGIEHVRFADEEFMAHRPAHAVEFSAAVEELAGHLAAVGLSVPSFDVAMRVDDVVRIQPGQDKVRVMEVAGERRRISPNELRYEALVRLKKLGLKQVYLGVESGSAAQLKRMRKAASPIANEKAIAMLRELQIQAACGWIMFDPFMRGATDLLENCAFIERNQLLPMRLEDDFVTNPINRMRVLAGTPLLDSVAEAGLLGQRRSNGVEFGFTYEDPSIERLISILERWESEFDRASLYELKNVVAHGGLEGGSETDAVLGFFELKALDFEVCRSLVNQLACGSADKDLVVDFEIPEPLLRRRDELRLGLSA